MSHVTGPANRGGGGMEPARKEEQLKQRRGATAFNSENAVLAAGSQAEGPQLPPLPV